MRRHAWWMVVGVGSLIVRGWMRARRWSRLSDVTSASDGPTDHDDAARVGGEGDEGSPGSTDTVGPAQSAVARSLELRKQMAEQAASLASTEDQVANTFERLAQRGGPRESEQRAVAKQARDYAEVERRRAAHYRTSTATQDAGQGHTGSADKP